MRVSNRQHLALNVCSVCVHALAPCAHLLVPIGSVCQGGDEEGQKDVQNNIFFPLPPLVLDRDVQARLSMTMFTPLLWKSKRKTGAV